MDFNNSKQEKKKKKKSLNIKVLSADQLMEH